jgi:hypothetical protein
MIVLPVEAVVPLPQEPEEAQELLARAASVQTREELCASIEKGASLDTNYLLLVALSTIVAAIGMSENNVAVVIGAMVIAPLLGPNLALILATALGDRDLIRRALATGTAGVALAVAFAFALGLVVPLDLASEESYIMPTSALAALLPARIIALAGGRRRGGHRAIFGDGRVAKANLIGDLTTTNEMVTLRSLVEAERLHREVMAARPGRAAQVPRRALSFSRRWPGISSSLSPELRGAGLTPSHCLASISMLLPVKSFPTSADRFDIASLAQARRQCSRTV